MRLTLPPAPQGQREKGYQTTLLFPNRGLLQVSKLLIWWKLGATSHGGINHEYHYKTSRILPQSGSSFWLLLNPQCPEVWHFKGVVTWGKTSLKLTGPTRHFLAQTGKHRNYLHLSLFNALPWVANPTLYHCNSGIYGNEEQKMGKSDNGSIDKYVLAAGNQTHNGTPTLCRWKWHQSFV